MLLAPIGLAQGLLLRRRLPRLPEAAGERQGVFGQATPALRLVALGESPLAGVGLANQNQGLAARLAELLANRTGRSVQWQTAAKGGVTARQTTRTLVDRLDPGPASLILIGLGVNDSLKLQAPAIWQQDLHTLIDTIRDRTGPAPVLLAGVPDMGHFPALPAPLSILLGTRARLLDAAAAELATRLEQVCHVSMPLDARMQDLFCSDGFHPAAEGHRLWAQQLLEPSLALLESSRPPSMAG
jgi:lysophospholipase L1-like esterase